MKGQARVGIIFHPEGDSLLHNSHRRGRDGQADLIELVLEMVYLHSHLASVVGEVLLVYIDGPALDIAYLEGIGRRRRDGLGFLLVVGLRQHAGG